MHKDQKYDKKVFFSKDVKTMNIQKGYTNDHVRALCYKAEDRKDYSLTYSSRRYEKLKNDKVKLERDVHSAIAKCIYQLYKYGQIVSTDYKSD